MKVSLLSLGCRVNQAEITEMEKALQGKGHGIVGLNENPDICIINTCSVTSKSDYQSRQLIRRAQKAGARVFVTGCYSELNREAVSAMSGVEAVIENSNKSQLINSINNNGECITSDMLKSRTRLFVKVQDGCNYSCSYCVITKARGASRSVDVNDVVSRINEAVSAGYKEVIINGVHLGLYGQDLNPSINISCLLEIILEKTGISRIRLGSLHIDEIDEALIRLMKEDRMCKHLHIPLQSGDDNILRNMKRTYDSALIRDRIVHLASEIDGIAIGTDLIAGFPLENELSFRNTSKLVSRLPFAYMHIFPYSRRPGTEAYHMRDIVGPEERRRRASILRDIAREKRMSYMDRYIGKMLDVLVEEEIEEGKWKGTSGNYLKLTFRRNGFLRGDIVTVRAVKRRGDMLHGKCVDKMKYRSQL